MNIEFDDQGLKKIKNNLEKMNEFEHGEDIPIEEIFTPEFMKRYTKSRDFEEILLESGFVNCENPFNQEIFEAIPDEEWDEYISKNTSYSTWEDILKKASEDYISNVLFRGLK